ncbi:MAG: hypothetical protein CGU28_09130 [Candidatus Dactylopiibacterium carminicum]|uniref:DUF58 domain-containing protein n=1 Tax=Candidatus Dactylopiibacterium carminicum TaxID=857335 RepID=A0A272ERY6_9RHOO|nr:DUF58 domain-containing protein [Candidatus Dactylopiibacterium carminicum]KAF7598959.1 DUF58 domain-containing protein [Candidatus Dactylopiibacterium carminicum]PAS92855.1 MAG: hypothetical protein CGU29_09920 [Candidatus Dactylopiibacterium carminicum]PAS96359.1 MAG: hypothetical protein CGU28_09130 [Candidatus Dactylopiibacterium carminicum]PAS98973.1 MAG: hypothetical protein BSR46_10495 [Candidatus Dactylopiibacterium carminicum]
MTQRLAGLKQRWRRWAIRGRIPEPQPIRLRAARIYVFPSRAGFALLITLLVMLIASINYNLSLGYGLVFLLGAVFVLHILHAWRGLHGLELRLAPAEEIFADAQSAWHLQLRNAQRHERAGIVIRSADGQALGSTDLAANAQALLRLNLPGQPRGLRQPGLLTLETRQPLGWIRAWAHIAPDAPVLVYPAPHGEHPLPSRGQDGGDTGAGLASPQADDFAGLRTFQPGDSLRQVAWKQLARGQGMLTKVFASQQRPECVLDWDALSDEMDIERRLGQLTRWLLEARQHGLRCSLYLPGRRIGPGEDATHYRACLESLALHPAEADDAPR